MMNRMLYSALLYLLMPIQFHRLWRRGRTSPAYRERWAERLAFFPPLEEHPRIWLHAVSVGETIAARPLVEALLERFPDHRLLLTTTTPTGSAQVKRLYGDRVEHLYFPYDLPGAVKRFLARSRPRLLVVMETELWLNCFHHCHRRQIPVLIANARLSERSIARYRRFPALTRRLLSHITTIAAQSDADRRRFIELGAAPARVIDAGNMKFDLTIPATIAKRARALRQRLGETRPIWIAASTHDGEEEPILDAHRRIRQRHPDALLILVPRHPERFDTVARLCDEMGFTPTRRSREQWPGTGDTVYLADTMGELLLLYAAADLAFVGGSFDDTGGHNPLEPAALGLPTLTGPTIHNFTEVYRRLIDAGNSEIVETATALAAAVIRLFDDATQRQRRGEAGRSLIETSRGSTERIVGLITAALGR